MKTQPSEQPEPYVVIPGCRVLLNGMRAVQVDSTAFTGPMWVPISLLKPDAPLPDGDLVTDLIVLKRFVVEFKITDYKEL